MLSAATRGVHSGDGLRSDPGNEEGAARPVVLNLWVETLCGPNPTYQIFATAIPNSSQFSAVK